MKPGKMKYFDEVEEYVPFRALQAMKPFVLKQVYSLLSGSNAGLKDLTELPFPLFSTTAPLPLFPTNNAIPPIISEIKQFFHYHL
jgi:hypothetical protein